MLVIPISSSNIIMTTLHQYQQSGVCVHSGVTGDVIIDDNGDRDTNFAILDMDVDTGQFQVIGNLILWLLLLLLLFCFGVVVGHL